MTSASSQVVPTKLEVYDSRFYDLVPKEASLIQLFAGGAHSGGPVYIPTDESLIWSDVITVCRIINYRTQIADGQRHLS